MTIENRRDSFCGKMSVCNNLDQYGIPFTLTSRHTMDPDCRLVPRRTCAKFLATCRVVRGLRGRADRRARRPAGRVHTVRYSEKLLEKSGISVETLDLSEAFGKAERLTAADAPT